MLFISVKMFEVQQDLALHFAKLVKASKKIILLIHHYQIYANVIEMSNDGTQSQNVQVDTIQEYVCQNFIYLIKNYFLAIRIQQCIFLIFNTPD